MSKPKGHIEGRSSVTGKFVPLSETQRRPNTTVREIIPTRGHGDSGRYDKPPPKK